MLHRMRYTDLMNPAYCTSDILICSVMKGEREADVFQRYGQKYMILGNDIFIQQCHVCPFPVTT